MRLRRGVLSAIVFTLAFCSSASAEEICKAEDETLIQCLNRLEAELDGALAAEADAVQAKAPVIEETVAAATTSEGAGEEEGGKRDYLAKFFAALGLGTVEDKADSLILNFNTDFIDVGPNSKVALRSVIREPKLSERIVKALPEANRANLKSALEETLDDFDDVAVEMSWTRGGEGWGRAEAGLADRLLAEASAKAEQANEERQEEFLQLLRDENLDLDSTFAALNDRSTALATQVAGSIENFAQSLAAEQQAIASDLQTQIPFFARLVDNQPQLNLSASFRSRGELVGPEELSAKLTWEHGLVNANSFRRWSRSSSCLGLAACLSDYETAVGRSGKAEPRLTLALEYARVEEFDFQRPTDAVAIHLDSTNKTIGSLTYSRYFGRTPPQRSGERVADQRIFCEIRAKYEDVSEDPDRQNRFVASAAFSRRISADLTGGLTFVYANKPEFRGDVDKELSARLGVKFSVDEE